jgi:hypothetical protein
MRGSGHAAGLAAVTLALCLASACSPSRRPEPRELPPARVAPPEPSVPAPVREVPPPTAADLQAVVSRIFGDAVVPAAVAESPFVVGDFNGDQSQDIAIVVRPAPGRVEALNEEYPRWILKDALGPGRGDGSPPRVKPNEVLLAVVHGYGPAGWRDTAAMQTYLLKNAVGSRLTTRPGAELARGSLGRKAPRAQGDVIGQVLRGAAGYLYYTGPTYAWYDPKTFAGEPERRLVHGRSMSGSQ